MRILITAGGTSEKIDEVRAITNHSSGKLGAEIARAFLSYPVTIDYVTTAAAVKPPTAENLMLHTITSTADLLSVLTNLLQTQTYDAVIHSMAVSDFTPEVSISQEVFLTALNDELEKQPQRSMDKERLQQIFQNLATTEKKISSQTEQLFLVLKQTPKVIQTIKKIQPDTLLVGFKLLVGVTKEELLQVAQENIKKNHADYVLANDLENITATQHIGYLVDANGHTQKAETKPAIAEMIASTLSKRMEERK